MRTSTKLILSAIVILVIAIGIYNRALKAEYLSGNYKKPYRDYHDINIKDFSEIEIKSSDIMLVTIEQGDFAIHQRKDGDSIKFTQVGNKLFVNADLPEKPGSAPNYTRWRNSIVIVCPKLTLLTASAGGMLINGKTLENTSYHIINGSNDEWGITLKKFNTDSIAVNLMQSSVGFVENNIQHLGIKAFTSSSIEINESNKIQQANLQINDYSNLNLGNVAIAKLTYQIADSAKVNISGASLKSFIKK